MMDFCTFGIFITFAIFVMKSTILGLRHRSLIRSNRISRKLQLKGGSRPNVEFIDIPGTDKKIEYNYIQLENSIKVLMVRDPTSQKSSAALAVKVGAASDPDDKPGLAHFTEHAVFLGSEMYPKENEYKDFLNKHAGTSNAATAMEYTNYKFEVNSNAFSEALSIFSQFFKSPLFSEDAIGREVCAVDAEDSKNRIIDGRRILQVIKHQIIENHPYAKFSTGNINTLASGDAIKNANEVRDAMRMFHERYYLPQNMALSLVGPQHMPELESLAKTYFSDISTHNFTGKSLPNLEDGSKPSLVPDNNNVYPFKQGGVLIRIRPIKDIRDISILFSLPSTRGQYKTDPCRLLRHLLNHKGEGSLFSKLQDKGFISSTSAGTSIDYVDFKIFEISATLTPTGFDNYEAVIQSIYNHIRMIIETPDTELQRVWKEIKSISAIDFNFQEKSSAYELAPFVSKQMLDVPIKHVFSAGYLLDDSVDIKEFRKFCRLLCPERAVMILRSETFDWLPLDSSVEEDKPLCINATKVYNQKEKYYGIHYHLEKFNTDNLDASNVFDTAIPSANPYIAYELENKFDVSTTGKLESSYPVQVPETVDGFYLWHSKDEVFGHPKSSIFSLLFTNETADGSPLNSMISTIFSQRIARKMYQANLAGIGYSVDLGTRGISFSFVGYSPSLQKLVDQITEDFTNDNFWNSVDPLLFTNIKERIIRSLKSWIKERPDSQCDTLLSYLLQENTWLPSQLLVAAELITIEDVQKRAQSLLSGTKLITYVHGNMNLEETLTIHHKLSSTIGKQIVPQNHKENYSRGRFLKRHTVVALPCFGRDVNNALLMHIQADIVSPKTSAYLMLIRRFMSEPLFSELRTQKQLGYIVGMAETGHGRSLGSIKGLNFRILSNRFDPQYLEGELDDFLARQSIIFSKLSQQDVSDRAAAIIKSLIDPPNSYLEEAGMFRDCVFNNTPFDWMQQVVKELETINIDDFVKKTQDWLFVPKETRKSVSFMLFGNQNLNDLKKLLDSESNKIIKSVEELSSYRDTLDLYTHY